jgi:hypothetical protein
LSPTFHPSEKIHPTLEHGIEIFNELFGGFLGENGCFLDHQKNARFSGGEEKRLKT